MFVLVKTVKGRADSLSTNRDAREGDEMSEKTIVDFSKRLPAHTIIRNTYKNRTPPSPFEPYLLRSPTTCHYFIIKLLFLRLFKCEIIIWIRKKSKCVFCLFFFYFFCWAVIQALYLHDYCTKIYIYVKQSRWAAGRMISYGIQSPGETAPK